LENCFLKSLKVRDSSQACILVISESENESDHFQALTYEKTEWAQILELYPMLCRLKPRPS
jgi:hypothetical protein